MRYASPLPLDDRETSTADGSQPDHSPVGPTITLVRPLLNVPRADLRAYCARRGLSYREDSSNETTTPQRNWLRHAVLPLLETRYPAVARTLARTAHVLAADHAYLDATAEDWLSQHAQQCADGVLFAHAEWRALPLALQTAVLRCAVSRVAGHTQGLEHAHVADARKTLQAGTTGVASALPGGLLCRAEHDGVWIGYAPEREPFAPITLCLPGRTAIAPLDCSINAVLVAPQGVDFCAGDPGNDAWLDAAKVGGPLSVRTRLPGDRFHAAGHDGRKEAPRFYGRCPCAGASARPGAAGCHGG